ncbi:Phenol hydroxylase subunit [compost metagenome]|uniref:Phenol hydroxylase P0 protein n=1 Tax=Pseudomonas linyingensis TaxID=915471 RepID=A0A1H6YQ36_9PSED|nr:phenol hydroxylase subunit [Pseudomonas linyingensis]SEJ42476.1 phenol hydroxylase P0 protein [Pseudomonas linyingensis]
MTRPDQLVEMVPATLDTRKRWVRVTGERAGGFIEFDFAIGEPELIVEMILSPEAFAEFCAQNQVELLPPREPDSGADEPSDWDWRLADATQTRFKQ